MNFLITGGLGFIGSNFVNYMADKYDDYLFVVIDKKDYCSSIDNVNDRHNIKIIIGDISNKELVGYILKNFNINIIVHFAAQTHVDNSFYNSIPFTINNVLGTHILLETVKIYQDKTNAISKFIHVSTDEVYGEVLDDHARCEGAVLDPTNPYAASKAAAEFFVKSYYYSYKLPIIITRGNNVYGPNQYPEKVIPRFICQLLDKEKITIHGTGKTKRHFVHVNDVVTAFDIIISKGEIGQTYNIGADVSSEYTVNEIGKIIIEKIVGKFDKNYITYVEDRKFNDYRYLISNQKLKELGWEPKFTNFEQNIDELISWYASNRQRFSNTTDYH